MKKFITLFITILITFAGFSQGTNPVPVGYGINKAIDFQARVLDSAGTYYNNIYAHEADKLYSYGITPTFAMYPAGAADGKLMSQIPTDGSGDFTVTRGSAATFINREGKIETAPANIPRFDYSNGIPVLLTEDAGENLLTHPLTMSDFTQSGATLDNNGGAGYTAPSVDYPTGALKLVEDGSNGVHQIEKYIGAADGESYSTLFYIKPAERTEVVLYGGNMGSDKAIINLIDETITPSSNVVNSSIKSVADGWYRCFVTVTNSAKQIYLRLYNGTSDIYQGDGTSGVYIAFPQLEQNSFASSWMFSGVEDGSTSLRSKDVISGATYTGDSESGVLFAEISALSNSNAKRSISITDGTADTYVGLRYGSASNSIQGIIRKDGINQALLTSVLYNTTDIHKVAISWTNNLFKLFIDGELVATDLSGDSFLSGTLTTMDFHKPEIGDYFYGKTKQLLTLPYLSDEQMVELTTP